MAGRPEIARLLPIWGAAVCLLAGCHLQPTASAPQAGVAGWDAPAGPLALTDPAAPAPLPLSRPPQVVEVERTVAPAEKATLARKQADALLAGDRSRDAANQIASISTSEAGLGLAPRRDANATSLVRDKSDRMPFEQSGDLPKIPLAPQGDSPGVNTLEPPIRPAIPVAPAISAANVPSPAQVPPSIASGAPPAQLPPSIANSTAPGPAGPIVLGGQNITFDALARIVDGNAGPGMDAGCSSCGDCGPGRPCTPGAQKCEPFPDDCALYRALGLVYEVTCCPDPCYEPHWEPIADSAFFVDPARPISNTRFQWTYASHIAYPDRAAYYWAPQTRGPAAVDGLRAVPYLNSNELMMVTEIAQGAASVAIAMPYRSWDAEPFAHSAAGFSDMNITAKTLLVDTELFLCAMQFRTYLPTGNATKGLGDGHVSLEPGLIFGLRLTPTTFAQAEVQEWIPIGGDSTYQGAFLQWGLSVNQLLWQPVRDVKLIGTLELTGNSFQDGAFTDPVLGVRKLSGENNVAIGNGFRLFYCRFDIGAAGNYAITGKYMAKAEMQFDMRFRY